jgi:phosphoribosylanthranilate isomerase
MWVKICGTTNLEDALLAVDAGADAVGFVFAESSKRRVTPEQVAPIARALPSHVEKVGVIVNESHERIAEIVRIAGLTGVQLQGDESPELTSELRRLGLRLLVKTIQAITATDTLATRIAPYRSHVDAILLDSGSPAERGGTGKRFAWKEAAAALNKVETRIIVAGGLNPDNVAEAIATLQPWGVDVVTGVERELGKKDPDKVRAFVAAARNAHQKAFAT